MARGLYRHGETVAMVLFEKNSMIVPKDDYDLRGYQPAFETLPTHAEWVERHRVHGQESMTQAEWRAWLNKTGRDKPDPR
ncbi:hypothetical protein [Mesorhizobium comanense]|uniref:hypothetical protein n=1 Tax=Mesorhizobium comanense TaxID=2502215 RepID=UPI0010F724DE|nr:hypothetical protein [Mesorhizobium comanense]